VSTLPNPVDPTALAAWAQGRLPGDGALEVTSLGDGHSNLTFLLRRLGLEQAEQAEQAWVLRRPPLGPLLPTAHDVVREYRVLSLLAAAGTPVRVPAVVALCEDAAVLGAPFYVMELTEGTVIRDQLPDWMADDPLAQHAVGIDLVDTLAEIHRVDWRPFVAAGIGRPDGYLARQLRRWTGQRQGIQAAVAAAGGQARELPDYDVVREWLVANLPAESEPAVVHGDFKLDNAIVRRTADGPRVAAVVDWEMATVGDPRADLGYLLSFLPDRAAEDSRASVDPVLAQLAVLGAGFPTRDELAARWAEGTGRDPGDLRWFVALAVWKLAILLEASYHRWLAGMSDDPFFGTLDTGVPALLARARGVCGV
jgi:aminoglycoside phosphotransferase (APT) family kinase protein